MRSAVAFKNPRIAFLHSALPVGGATIFLLNLVGELVRRGIPAQVFSMEKAHPLSEEFARQGIPVSLGETNGLIFEDRVYGALSRVARFRPDVIVANINPGTCEVLRHAPEDVLRVAVLHAASQLDVTRCYVGTMDRLITVSSHMRDLLAQVTELKSVPKHWAALGIPLAPSTHRENVLSGHALRVLYLGTLHDSAKRVRLFPAILQRLKEAQIPFAWTIAGEGPERRFLESQMVVNREDQRIEFTGVVPYAKVPALLAAHDILLLTSDTETFSFSLHEAMAAGLVPVASDLPGPVRDIIVPDAGILVPPAKVSGYADGIIWLHANREKMSTMSEKARAAIGREHSVEAMTDRWLDLLSAPLRKPPQWPARWDLLPPLISPNSWRFSKLGRFLRRGVAKAVGMVRSNAIVRS